MNFAFDNAVLVQVHTQCLAAAASLRLKPLTGVPPWKMPPAPSAGKPYGTLTLMDRLDSSAAKIEIAWYTGRTDNGDGTYTYTGLLRGQEGTTARQWEVGEWAMQAPTAKALAMELAFAKSAAGFALKHRTNQLLRWDGVNFDFVEFYAVSLGRGSHWVTDGIVQILRPTTGTVIAGYGGHAGATVVAGGIPMSANSSLWYELPIGAGGASVNGNFRLVGATSAFVVPAHWLLIAAWPNYDGLDLGLRVGDGSYLNAWNEVGAVAQPAFANSWVNFGASWETAGFFKDANQIVRLKGLIKSGVITAGAFVLPVGYRPAQDAIFATAVSGAAGELRVLTNGFVIPQAGNNTYFSLAGITFRAAQ